MKKLGRTIKLNFSLDASKLGFGDKKWIQTPPPMQMYIAILLECQ